jgi:hypothetical protein
VIAMSELLITGGLWAAYLSLRGTKLALGALETVVTRPTGTNFRL